LFGQKRGDAPGEGRRIAISPTSLGADRAIVNAPIMTKAIGARLLRASQTQQTRIKPGSQLPLLNHSNARHSI
jgi:hypothetical protein